MKQLEKSIVNFIQTVNKYPKEEYPGFRNGGLRYRSESVNIQVDEKIHLSPELQFFYEHCEINCASRDDGFQSKSTRVDFGSTCLGFWSPEGLVSRQDGFRWNAIDGKEDPSWSAFWLVIADINDDPIVVETDKKDSPVMAFYEAGDLFPIANTFAEFLDYLTITFELVHGKYNGKIVDDESFEFLEGFIEDLIEVLSKVNKDHKLVGNFIEYLYGYYV